LAAAGFLFLAAGIWGRALKRAEPIATEVAMPDLDGAGRH
jgi:hypothetical protein